MAVPYEKRLAQAKATFNRRVAALKKTIGTIESEFAEREPLQDDEDDTLEMASDTMLSAKRCLDNTLIVMRDRS